MQDQWFNVPIGEFVIRAHIGEGGMGHVYLAEAADDHRRVAVKILDPSASLSRGVVSRFDNESKLLSQLQHPNIVEVYDAGELRGHLYYTMEYLAGPTLAQMISEHAPMPLPLVRHYLSQICHALEAAHGRGIVHRDLKPQNIMLTDTTGHQLKVVDFGIAKVLSPEAGQHQATMSGALLGSPLVMSPEQAAGRISEIGPHSDLYAVGVIAYWMLAGRPPFADAEHATVLYKHMMADPPPLAELAPTAPEPLVSLVEQALAKAPKDRPASARAFADALASLADAPTEALLAEVAIPTPNTPQPLSKTTASAPATQPAQPRRRTGLLVSLTVILAAAAMGLYAMTRQPPQQPADIAPTTTRPGPAANTPATGTSPHDAMPADTTSADAPIDSVPTDTMQPDTKRAVTAAKSKRSARKSRRKRRVVPKKLPRSKRPVKLPSDTAGPIEP